MAGDTANIDGPKLTGDSVIDAVINSTRPFKDRDHARQPPIKLGSGRFYVVTFTGESGTQRLRYVYDGKGPLQVYEDLRQLLLDYGGSRVYDERFFLIATVCVGFILSLLAMIGFGMAGNSTVFQAATGLTTLIVGYIFGTLGTPKPALPPERLPQSN